MAVNAHLRKLAKKAEILEGAVILYFVPFATPYTSAIVTELNTAFPDNEDQQYSLFTLLEAHVMDMEFKQDTPYADALKAWWETRGETPETRYTVFSMCVPFDLWTPLIRAFKSTREQFPQPSQIIMEGAPVLDGSPLAVSVTPNGGAQ